MILMNDQKHATYGYWACFYHSLVLSHWIHSRVFPSHLTSSRRHCVIDDSDPTQQIFQPISVMISLGKFTSFSWFSSMLSLLLSSLNWWLSTAPNPRSLQVLMIWISEKFPAQIRRQNRKPRISTNPDEGRGGGGKG